MPGTPAPRLLVEPVRILVTGSSGCLGRVLVPALLADPRVTHVTGIDLRDAVLAHPRFTHVRADLAAADTARLLPGLDAAVHLGYVVLRGRRSLAQMARVNVEGSARLIEHAHACGVHRQVLLSSAAVYGSGVDLTESAPCAPLAGFAYGAHKAALEDRIARTVPGCVRLRPHAIFGRHAQPLLRALMRCPVYPRLAEEPPLQCVHEDDVVTAIRSALEPGVPGGAFNLAAPETFSYGGAVRRRSRHAVGLPLGLLRAGITVAWRTTGLFGEPGWVEGLARPLTLDCRRARTVLGWKPARTGLDAISEAAA